ncbi:outer membrane protein, OmpH-like protein [Bacteriovorax sp. BSW11_IV]|uniref:OmpH family outer membrane protein n=1 Tax=Bacteriovorax sp. BSW11_IV TaxID=1353529 RepID=UPI000389FE50|nr:OmpH family outer membrane protein [Bacteriovorax sp. BSW11_IV]EQC48946.1 outer membrane protein, OmpH-like protein [Bacteriovorax sp. BSW11_IV]
MKKLIALCLALTFTTPAFALLIGKVDVQNVLLSIEEGKRVREKLKKKFDEKQGIIKKEEDKIKKAQEDFQKQSLVMNDKAKQTKQMEIQKSIMKLQQETAGYQKEIQDMENEMKKPILDKLKVIIEEVSAKAGVDVTFESNTAPIIYAKSEKDLTEDVVKAYNKKHK